MELFLDENIFSNETNYFFSLHGPRFEYMNTIMAKTLSDRFRRNFKPIRILNAWPNENYDQSNYIILNKRGYKLKEELNKPVVYLPDYEDVNVEFSRNPKILEIAQKLLQKQDTVFVYPFTTAFLDLKDSIFTVLGPNSILATTFDNKINQFKLFRKLGLPCNNARIYEDEKELLEHEDNVVPSYISAAYSSGGNESGLIYSKEMLQEFLAKLRAINKQNKYIVSDIFEDIVNAPNVNALITSDGKILALVISDQILHGNRYLGNIYPSAASDKHRALIIEITEKIGIHLYEQGYKGLFGLDFLINAQGELVVIDLNPRHQGGYACNHLMLQTKHISLCELELKVFYDEQVILSQAKLNKDYGFAWAHSKIAPYEKGQIIKASYEEGTISNVFTEVGSSFVTSFYKQSSVFIDGYIGYQVMSSKTKNGIESRLISNRKLFDSRVLGV